MQNTFNELKREGKRVRANVLKRSIGYIMAGLGLVAGLAWNDAIASFIQYVFPSTGNTVLAKFVYAAILTVLIVLVGSYLVRTKDTSE